MNENNIAQLRVFIEVLERINRMNKRYSGVSHYELVWTGVEWELRRYGFIDHLGTLGIDMTEYNIISKSINVGIIKDEWSVI